MRHFIDTEDTWDDLRFPAATINPPGQASDPDVDATNGYLLFAASGTELVFFQVQLPHHYKENTAIHPHVHWQKTTSAGGDVYWQFSYKVAKKGAVMDSTFTHQVSHETGSISDGGKANQHAITEIGSIPASTSLTFSDMLICRLSRLGGETSDTYSHDAAMMEFDLHYQGRNFGTKYEYSRGPGTLDTSAGWVTPTVTEAVNWNPDNKSANIIKDGLQLDCDNAAWCTTVADTVFTSGKVYFEVVYTSEGAGSGNKMVVGIESANHDFRSDGTYVGGTATGVSIGFFDSDGRAYKNNAQTSSKTAGWTDGDVIGIAVEVNGASSKIWLSINGSWDSGDPAAGTNPEYTFTADTDVGMVPAISFYGIDSNTNQQTGQFITADLTYTSPENFSPLTRAEGLTSKGINFAGSANSFIEENTYAGSTNTATKLTLSAWILRDGNGVQDRWFALGDSGDSGVLCRFQSDNTMQILMYDTADTTVVNATTTAVWDVTGEWEHFILSFDITDNTKRHIMKNGVSIANTWTTYDTAKTVDCIRGAYAIGANPSGANVFDGALAQIWWAEDQYVDLADNQTLKRFYNNGWVDFGDDGSIPTGTSPHLYLDTEDATDGLVDFLTNKGSGGGTWQKAAGTIDDRASHPSWNFDDKFDRADSTTLGNGWTEKADRWEVSENEIICDASGNWTNTQMYQADDYSDSWWQVLFTCEAVDQYNMQLWSRYDTNSTVNGYLCYYQASTQEEFRLCEVTNDSITVLQTASWALANWVDGRQYRATFITSGTSIRCKWEEWSSSAWAEICDMSDTDSDHNVGRCAIGSHTSAYQFTVQRASIRDIE